MLFVAALTASTTASANYYGYLRGILANNASGGDAATGAAVYVETDSLVANSIISGCPYFVTHEMWYGVSDFSLGNYWVEVGFVDGVKSGGQSGCADKDVFWADRRNGGGYHEHYPNFSPGFSFGTWFQLWILQNGSCSWSVHIGDVYLGSSTSNCPLGNSRNLTVGIESNSRSANNWAKGSAWDWARSDSLGNWWSGWGSTFFYADNYPSIRFDPNYAYGTVTNEVLNVSF